MWESEAYVVSSAEFGDLYLDTPKDDEEPGITASAEVRFANCIRKVGTLVNLTGISETVHRWLTAGGTLALGRC